MLQEIPLTRPQTPLLDAVDTPADLRRLERHQLESLAEEVRAFLLWSVGQTGGHFGAGLGVVELTVALHYLYNTPDDRIVWDVGHQTYPHKILTGRKDRMHTMRQANEICDALDSLDVASTLVFFFTEIVDFEGGVGAVFLTDF